MLFNYNILLQFSIFLDRENLRYLKGINKNIKKIYEKDVKRKITKQRIEIPNGLDFSKRYDTVIYEFISLDNKDGKYFSINDFSERVITNYKNNHIHGRLVQYFEFFSLEKKIEKAIRKDYFYINGSLAGEQREYHSNNTKTKQISININGEEKIFYYINLKHIFNMEKGKKNGEEKIYYNNGSLLVTRFYVNNLKEGKFQKFYMNRNLNKEGFYSEGCKIGEYKIFFEDGKIQEIKFYKKILNSSVLHGKRTYVDRLKNVVKETIYENGKKEGFETVRGENSFKQYFYGKHHRLPITVLKFSEHYFSTNFSKNVIIHTYNEDKKCVTSREYENGLLTKQASDFYYSGRLKVVANYSYGILNGKFTTYYNNKDIQTDIETNYSYGKLHGRFIKYYPNSLGKNQSPMIICYYKHGNLHGDYIEYDREYKVIFKERYIEGILQNITN